MTDNKQPETVLVVGDWYIDEYWFVVRHHSDISSHPGPIHYRIASESGEEVRDLCGAGLVARVFYELRRYGVNRLKERMSQIRWNPDAPENFKYILKKLEGGLTLEEWDKRGDLWDIHLVPEVEDTQPSARWVSHGPSLACTSAAARKSGDRRTFERKLYDRSDSARERKAQGVRTKLHEQSDSARERRPQGVRTFARVH